MKPTQHELELSAFVEMVRSEGCSSYLEIGVKAGKSLDAVCSAMPDGSRVVAVDLPKKDGDLARMLLDHVLTGISERHELAFVIGNSADQQTIDSVGKRGPFDLVFIDADHDAKAVRADWENYGRMGRMVAFHDIADTGMGVAALWEELKQTHKHLEIRFDPRGNRNGIGVLWRFT